MVNFLIYDVAFLVLFSIWVVWFLRTRKKHLSREGIMFMYRTQFGVKAIKYVGDNFKKLLHALKYVIVGVGFVLMGVMLWMLGQTVSIYLLHPEITQIIKAPPVAPLIPYFPKLFGMQSFFPDFYFVYFILALAIVAIAHEFSHGVFMRLFKVKIKSTGIVFLGPILGAFVEQDDNSFKKKGKFEQMVVLAAGVFANVIFALIFYGLYVGFFFSSFSGAGYIFNSYGVSVVPVSSITGFENVGNLTKVDTVNGTYYLDSGLALQLNQSGVEYFYAYPEAPAVLAEMKGAIVQADDVKITGQEKLREFLESKNPGDNVVFVTEALDGHDSGEPDDGVIREYNITLGQHPDDSSRAYLGVGHSVSQGGNFVQNILSKFMSFKDSSTLYKPTWNADFANFILYLFWWIMIINLLVALFNMLPLGMLDGGRFFYLTILGIAKKEKLAKWAYRIMTYLILFMFLALMFFWFIRII